MRRCHITSDAGAVQAAGVVCRALAVSRRRKMSGFNVFSKECGKKGLLRSGSFADGPSRMREVAAAWRQLPKAQRNNYNAIGRQRSAVAAKPSSGQQTMYNLLLSTLAKREEFKGMAHTPFLARVTASTARALTPAQERAVRRRFHADDKPANALLDPILQHQPSFMTFRQKMVRFVCPDMRHFQSFTEMQRGVAPTRESAFVYSKALQARRHGPAQLARLAAEFEELSLEEQMRYGPIAEEERLLFETFCGRNCACHNAEQFDILNLFCLFRGLGGYVVQCPEMYRLYRSVLSADRDSLYSRAQDALRRMSSGRSADCGSLLAARHDPTTVVSPAKYRLQEPFDEVAVATLLSEYRVGDCVYDCLLEHVTPLRPDAASDTLRVYTVADITKRAATTARRAFIPPERLPDEAAEEESGEEQRSEVLYDEDEEALVAGEEADDELRAAAAEMQAEAHDAGQEVETLTAEEPERETSSPTRRKSGRRTKTGQSKTRKQELVEAQEEESAETVGEADAEEYTARERDDEGLYTAEEPQDDLERGEETMQTEPVSKIMVRSAARTKAVKVASSAGRRRRGSSTAKMVRRSLLEGFTAGETDAESAPAPATIRIDSVPPSPARKRRSERARPSHDDIADEGLKQELASWL